MISGLGMERAFNLVARQGRRRRWFLCLSIVAVAGCSTDEPADAELERIGELLSQRLQEGETPEFRRAAARGIGAIRETEGVSVLEVALGDDDPGVRAESLRSLAKLGAFGLFPSIAAALANDPAEEVRVAAALALGELLADPRAPASESTPLESLVRGAAEDRSPVVRVAALRGLRAALDDPRRAGHARAPGGAIGVLLDASESGSPAIREAAARALGALLSGAPPDPARIRSRLMKLLASDSKGTVRSAAASALAFADEAEIDLAGVLRGDPHASVRRSAALALGGKSGAVATGALIDALGDSDPIVRWAALHSLARGIRRGATAAITQALDDAAPIVRQRAAEALGSVPWPPARSRLLELALAASEPATVRAPAILALASSPHIAKPLFERLTLLLESEEEQILLAALLAFSKHPGRLRGHRGVVPRLIEHLGGGYGEVRILSAAALGATEDRSAAEALRAMLGADDARALASIGDEESLPAIAALAEQEEPDVAEQLREIVRKMEH